jgi:Fic family protein
MGKEKIILTLSDGTFASTKLPVSTGWLLAECMEFRGRQEVWMGRSPELLKALGQQAMVQSVESSNRIEGVTIAAERLRPVVLGKARPKDRPEEELAGYRRALDWIFARRGRTPIDARTILYLHALCQAGAGDAGKFKTRDNEIIEFNAAGERVVRFRPTSAKDTPKFIDQLAASYQQLAESENVPPLLLIATAVFDFLCIHPFRDGNGRVSRLLTTLLLQQHGFVVGRYVSLERLIEESKEDYYRVLKQCSDGWAEGKNQILPWWNYFLTILRQAYAEFAEQVGRAQARSGKSELVAKTALAMIGSFSLAEVHALLPGVSEALIKKVLSALKLEKKLSLKGRGRGARWQVS